MSAQTGIEWCDSTFNPWMGCTKVSPACDHCYAERQTARFKRVQWGAGKTRVRTGADNWRHPKRWNDHRFMECGACGWRGECAAELIGCGSCGSIDRMNDARRRVFCASLADWLDNEVSIEWLVDLLDLIRRTPNLDWLLLTKRIGNWRWRLMSAHAYLVESVVDGELSNWAWKWLMGHAPDNVWVMATVENQKRADEDIPKLLRVPAVVRGLSIEPMLGPVEVFSTMTGKLLHTSGNEYDPGCIDWIIAGGESGPHARPSHPDWYRSLRDQCAAAGVPFLFKQWGEYGEFVNEDHYTHGGEEKHAHAWVDRATGEHGKVWLVDDDGMWSNWTGDPRSADVGGLHDDIAVVGKHGKKAAGRQLDDRTHDGFPAVRP